MRSHSSGDQLVGLRMVRRGNVGLPLSAAKRRRRPGTCERSERLGAWSLPSLQVFPSCYRDLRRNANATGGGPAWDCARTRAQSQAGLLQAPSSMKRADLPRRSSLHGGRARRRACIWFRESVFLAPPSPAYLAPLVFPAVAPARLSRDGFRTDATRSQHHALASHPILKRNPTALGYLLRRQIL